MNKDIDTEIAANFWPANKPEVTTVVADYSPSKKTVESRKARIMARFASLSPHGKRMATVTQYTILVALGLSVSVQSFA